jgi:hypothetical protein
MVNINLLAWREQESDYQKNILKKMLMLALVLAAIVNIVSHLMLAQQENKIQKRIDNINEEIKTCSELKMPAKQDQDFWKQMFAEKKAMKESCFNEIKESDKGVIFAGRARSLSDLSAFLKHWRLLAFFSEIKVSLIEEDKKGGVRFMLEGKKI